MPKDFKQKAFELYNQWRKEEIYCPAFESKVRFSLKGWRHLIGSTGVKKRKLGDVYRRLKLLPYAREIIEKSTTIQNAEKRGRRMFYVLEAVVKVKQGGKMAPRKVRVIFEEDRQGNKVFLSVMDKKKR